MEFFNKTGKMAIGSRLRILTDKITEDAAKIYELYDVPLHPKWFPVFHSLINKENTITGIAQHIGHSHPSVSKIVAEMSKKGIVIERKDKNDGRKNIIVLSEKGYQIAEKMEKQNIDVNTTIEEILDSTQNNLWKAIEEWEFVLEQKSLLQRVKEQKKQRESKKVKIVNYTSDYKEAFKKLNEEWITTYFKMEPADYKALDNPEEYIINNGGYILIALYEGQPLGVCALLKMDHPSYDYELAKMAVSPKAQGKNIGWLLGQAIIDKARSLDASSIYLESNTILKPAINLYLKLGFEKIEGLKSPYKRCNIQMELKLK